MRKWSDLSIQRKISFLLLGCFIMLLVCVVGILYWVYREQIYKELIQRGQYEDQLILDQVENLTQNVESCCNNMIINLNLSIGSEGGILNHPEQYDQRIKEKILAVMENNFLLFPVVKEIYVLYENGDLYQKERNKGFLYLPGNEELRETVESTGVDTRGIWSFFPEETSSLYYLKEFRNVNESSMIGYIGLRIEEEEVYRIYQNQKTDNPSQIYIFDDKGQLVSSSSREDIEEIYQISDGGERKEKSQEIYSQLLRAQESQRGMSVRQYTTSKDWELISVLDIEAGMTGLQKITSYIVMIGLSLMLFFFCMTHMILRKIMNPVVDLARHMRETGENRIQKIEERDSKDEVGVLISSFNQMVETNEKLIRRVEKNEQEKRKLELALLQMQIKPHFLYNTLDTAFCLNNMNMYQEANYVIKQLAGYYRLVLNHGAEWISLSEELDAVKKYLEIQSVRYSEMMAYTISVDEELYEFRIPKMTLQPLVENAIYHGIKQMHRKGHILILGELCGDEVLLSVTDDGAGMTQKIFDEVLSGERKGTDKESFGLKAVAERLKLYYGGKTRIELAPAAVGTSIVLTIDLRKDGEY